MKLTKPSSAGSPKRKRTERALFLFEEGYNCAQAIATAFAPEGDAPDNIYLKIASSFGSGMARTGSTCGAVTGALMAIGLHLGPSQKGHLIRKFRIQRASIKFIREFEKRHSTTVCNPLRGQTADGKYHRGQKDLCPGFVQSVAEILEELL